MIKPTVNLTEVLHLFCLILKILLIISFKQKMDDDSDINRIHSHQDPFTNNLSDLINALDKFFGERPTHSMAVRKVRRRPRIPVNADNTSSSMARAAHLEQLHTSGMSSGEDGKNNTADDISDSENEISSRYILPFDRKFRRWKNSHVEPDSIMDTSQKRKTYRRKKPIKRMVVDSCLPAGKSETTMEVDNSPGSRFIPFGACLRVPKRICSESSMEHDDIHTVPSSDSEDNVSSCDHGRDGDDELSDFPAVSFCSDSCDSDDLDTSRSILRKIRNNLRNNFCDGECHAMIFDSTDSDVSPSAKTKKTKLDQ
ncbi:Anthranilate synthase component [Trichinella pseudospiralis]